MPEGMKDLTDLSDEELLQCINSELGSERQSLARLIRYLGEVEERRLHLQAAYSSMFEFCTRKLGQSEGEAFRRITAARLSRRFPVIPGLLEKGSLHLSALVLLRDHLTEENHSELLSEASGKSKLELQTLLAARFPKPDVPSRMRKLPARHASTASSEQPEFELRADPIRDSRAHTAVSHPAANPTQRGLLEPLAPARYKVQFTADEALKDKLDRARNLLSHANPTGDLAVIVGRAMDSLLAEIEKTLLGKTDRPRRSRKSAPGAITRAARREVFARDGERCSFVSAEGRRCSARAFLQLDHVEPRALGGSGESSKVRVLCAAHNRSSAERVFGKRHVEASIDLRRRKYDETAVRKEQDETYAKLLNGLTGLGFRQKPTRATLDSMRSGHAGVTWTAPLEVLLREAIVRLTS
jgi:hypothetical protein